MVWTKILLLVCLFVAAESLSNRPNPCKPGTTYKKDCNVCTCRPNGDICGQVNCSRYEKKETTTSRPSGERPGICPHRVTPPPRSNICAKRTQKSNCKVDKDCSGAKKCCRNGCDIFLCRNPLGVEGVKFPNEWK